MRPRRTVLHRLPGPIPIDPRFDRGPGALEAGGNLADRDALVDNELRDSQTGARGQGCVNVKHKRAFLA